MPVVLGDHQLQAIRKMHNGCVLVGGVGSGKSRTALAYYVFNVCGGSVMVNKQGTWQQMTQPRDLYIITTAKKRDSLEWEAECVPFELYDISRFPVNIVVDSWNNIQKYRKVFGAFFIFDEQRVVGTGAWVKSFLDIARKNQWILLTATPGDEWSDYAPVFIANGFYKNVTEFRRIHAVYNQYAKYPKIDRYVGQGLLVKHRNDILVPMPLEREVKHVNLYKDCDYSKALYMKVWRDRWDPFDNQPIQETGKLFYLLRKVVNSDPSRINHVAAIASEKKRCIIFYNFDYELEMLQELYSTIDIPYAEWNGHVHQPIPDTECWGYFVQYMAGSEGWNCITTDTIIFFSQSYSYKQMIQAADRTARLNTPYKELFYYHLKSFAPIDIAITQALKHKKNFNERAFLKQ
jgi:hypothetical protein